MHSRTPKLDYTRCRCIPYINRPPNPSLTFTGGVLRHSVKAVLRKSLPSLLHPHRPLYPVVNERSCPPQPHRRVYRVCRWRLLVPTLPPVVVGRSAHGSGGAEGQRLAVVQVMVPMLPSEPVLICLHGVAVVRKVLHSTLLNNSGKGGVVYCVDELAGRLLAVPGRPTSYTLGIRSRRALLNNGFLPGGLAV